MTAGHTDDIPTQLAALLGRETIRIRRTDHNPPQASIYDVISAVTGLNGNHAGKAYRDLTARYPDVHSLGVNFRFPGRGQRGTPVANVRGIVEVVMLLPGRMAARVRRQASELLCRFLGGDLSLVDEVCRMRSLQLELAAAQPEDPRRIFGQAVEVASRAGSG